MSRSSQMQKSRPIQSCCSTTDALSAAAWDIGCRSRLGADRARRTSSCIRLGTIRRSCGRSMPDLDIWDACETIHLLMPNGSMTLGGKALAEVLQSLPHSDGSPGVSPSAYSDSGHFK